MIKRVLITGGAGFIGSHVTDELLNNGYDVRILDSLVEQVHGPGQKRPDYLHDDAELVIGDVRNQPLLKQSLEGVDAVFHFAARVGVGQSMYEIKEYMDVNTVGTSILLETLLDHPIEKLIVASSMSIYGEGLYENFAGKLIHQAERNHEQLAQGEWDPLDENGNQLKPVPTPETKKPSLESVYALSKYDQEQLCLIAGRAYDMDVTALRFFNIYGSRQALSNPYTGVLAIFSSRYLNGNPPLIFEDGEQLRDFVHVKDVARACRLAMEVSGAANNTFNIGSGNAYSIKELAQKVGGALNKLHITPKITGKYRAGDIRHCIADISKAESMLGFTPKVSLDEGMKELIGWLASQTAEDHVDKAEAELLQKGLTFEGKHKKVLQ